MLRLFIIVKWLDYGVILSIIQGERLMNQLTLARGCIEFKSAAAK